MAIPETDRGRSITEWYANATFHTLADSARHTCAFRLKRTALSDSRYCCDVARLGKGRAAAKISRELFLYGHLLDVIDHQHFKRGLSVYQVEPQLFLKGLVQNSGEIAGLHAAEIAGDIQSEVVTPP